MKIEKTKYQNQDQLAKYFGKKYGEFLFSGTLAIETALISCGVQSGDLVLIPNNVCYRVLLGVVRVKAIPLIINPANGFVLTRPDISRSLLKYKIRAVILVHNFGIPVDVEAIKNVCSNKVTIIEDVSQAWDNISKTNPVGKFSDYVITSFGSTKPLSLGIGGGLFSNSSLFRKNLDNYDHGSRLSHQSLLPYVFPNSDKINVPNLIKLANKNISRQKKIAKILQNELKGKNAYTWKLGLGDSASWHRFPVWTNSKNNFMEMRHKADLYHVEYELPHKVSLNNTPLALQNGVIYIDLKKSYNFILLIKTRHNTILNIKKWTQSLK